MSDVSTFAIRRISMFEDAANFDVQSLRIHPLVIFSRSISSIHSIYMTDTLTYLSAQRTINRPASAKINF